MGRTSFEVGSLMLEVTRRCNMECEHCLRGCAQNKDMAFATIDKVLDTFSSIGSIAFTGGEPSLALDVIQYFFDGLRKRGKDVGYFWLATNGKANQEALALLLMKEYFNCYERELCGVALSVDSFHEYQEQPIIKLLSFYDNSKEAPNGGWSSLINEGSAKENELGGKDGIFTENLHVDTYSVGESICHSIEQVYVNALGEILPDCDFSYQSQEKYKLCDIDDFTSYIEQNFTAEAAA